MEDHLWSEQFTVRVYETDANGTLAVRSLCDFLQEAAGNHARTYGVSVDQLLDRGMTWILSRLRVRIERLPVNGERLTVRTWPAGVERLFALRDFTISDAEDTVVVSALSAWLIMDTQSRRPVRIQTQFVPPAADRPRPFAASFQRLPPIEPPGREQEITVRWSDLDVNRHVNNSRYAEWAVEGAAASPGARGPLTRLDIDFLAETQHPGSVIVQSRQREGEPLQMSHVIVRAEDRGEAARVLTEWRAT
jgi:medium-chain acyl-[acyl-carrier-protein] hydrolase